MLDSFAATQQIKAMVTGTPGMVASASSNTGLVDEECATTYNSCMDQFCMSDNDTGGRCMCSDDKEKFDKQLADIESKDAANEERSNRAIENLQAGAAGAMLAAADAQNADRQPRPEPPRRANSAQARALAMMQQFDEPDEPAQTDISSQTGVKKHVAADKLCATALPKSCDYNMIKLLYSQNIRNDCRAYEVALKQRSQISAELAIETSRAVREAALETFENENKYNRGQCLAAFRDCMRGTDVCGSNWAKCFGGALDHQQTKCEHVLDNCVAVRDTIWDDFLALAKPQIEQAEQLTDAEVSMSCLSDVSDCLFNSCKSDIEGKGVDTFDACLAHPEMVRSFCKVELDRCEPRVTGLWDFAKARLAGRRVDVCTKEVKECFQSPDRCGEDWTQCIGLDIDTMVKMCPVDKLVVCKQGNPDFQISDLGRMIDGLYLAMDSIMSANCQKIVDEEMLRICDSLTDCDAAFNDNDILGTQSLSSGEKIEINFSEIKISDGNEWKECVIKSNIDKCEEFERPGQISADQTIATKELDSIIKAAQFVINQLESVQKIKYCMRGRDMTQIIGKGATQTIGHEPFITIQYRYAITKSAIQRATANYDKKLESMNTE